MTDIIDEKTVRPLLEKVLLNLDSYDISTFKQSLRDIAETAETRDIEDQTDFSFLKRRSADRGD